MKRLVLFVLAAASAATPSAAAEVWTVVKGVSGTSALAQFDTTSGELVAGSAKLLDGVPGVGQNPVLYDNFRSMAFDPGGGLWVGHATLSQHALFGQFSADTGELVPGASFVLDGNTSGNTGQIPLANLADFAFSPDGGLWAAVKTAGGDTAVGQFSTTTGNLVGGSLIFLDAGVGYDQPLTFDNFAGMDFDSTGALWVSFQAIGGFTGLARFNVDDGEIVAGSNVLVDFNGPAALGQLGIDDFGGFAFDADDGLWIAARTLGQDTLLGQYSAATGYVVPGSNVLLDHDPIANNFPIPFANFADLDFAPQGVPEPRTWALLIVGFGLAGSALRRRQAALTG